MPEPKRSRRTASCGALMLSRDRRSKMAEMKLKYQLKFAFVPVLLVIRLIWGQERMAPSSEYRDWKVYGGGPDNIHYSALGQINRDNVHELAVAWTYDSGDAFPDSETECNPIVIHGSFYATTPKLRLIALDAATGVLRWSFDPNQGERVKQGNEMMRWLLVEAGQSAAQFDPELRRKYLRLKFRRGAKVAKVAMTRQLAVPLYWTLRQRSAATPLVRMPSSPAQTLVEASPSTF